MVPVPEDPDGVGRGQLRPAGVAVQRSHFPFWWPDRGLFRRPGPSGPRSLSLASSRGVRCAWPRLISAAARRIWPSREYQLDDGIRRATSKSPRSCCSAKGSRLLAMMRCWILFSAASCPPCKPSCKSRASPMPALMATLFGDSGRLDTQAVLRQQTTLQLFMPIGHAILAAWEQSDVQDPLAGLHATFGELLCAKTRTRNVMNYHPARRSSRRLPAGAAHRLICSAVPLDVSFREPAGTPCWRVSSRLPARCTRCVRRSLYYSCDILLITGRPGCLPGVQALIRHLQPVPVNRIVWLDKYQVHEWYPFSQQGRIGNPKSTAAVGAMLCSLALDLRLPRFNFKAADIGAYSTGALSGRAG